MKKLLLAFFVVLTFTSLSNAATIYFKDGTSITGAILDKNNFYTVIQESNGMPKKFNQEVIQSIEEDKAVVESAQVVQFEDLSPEKKTLILRYLQANGTRSNMEINLRETIAKASDKDRATYKEILDVERILDMLIPIYAKYYNVDDLNKLIEFYESSTRQKEVEVTPNIMKETMQATVEYFKKAQDANPELK